MNAPHWHLMMIHFPVVGMSFGLLLWSLGWGLKSWDLQRMALAWLVVIGLLTWFAYWTGQNSHAPLHDLLTVPHAVIDHHAHWAWRALIAVEATTILAAIGLWQPPRPVLKAGILIIAGIGTALIFYTAHLGGLIHHPETWPDFKPAAPKHHHHPHPN